MGKCGTFYGIGVGPGDPELITVKAQKVLEKIHYLFAPVAKQGGQSIAYTIAQQYIAPDARIEMLHFPMTTDLNVCEKAWEEHVMKIFAVVNKGDDAAFITMGDPMTFSTYGYLLRKMQVMYPQVPAVTIPGIPSYAAVAASAHLPLVQGNETLTLIPGTASRERIRKLLSLSDTVIFLKHHKTIRDCVEIVHEMGLHDKLLYVNHCGFEDQAITSNPTPELLEKNEYLSLLIVKTSSK
jgi:precorrin-2/cobalt-factor-2 C20-methyltransferase